MIAVFGGFEPAKNVYSFYKTLQISKNHHDPNDLQILKLMYSKFKKYPYYYHLMIIMFANTNLKKREHDTRSKVISHSIVYILLY